MIASRRAETRSQAFGILWRTPNRHDSDFDVVAVLDSNPVLCWESRVSKDVHFTCIATHPTGMLVAFREHGLRTSNVAEECTSRFERHASKTNF